MPANARTPLRPVDSTYPRATPAPEPVLGDLPSGRIPGSNDVTRAYDAWFSRKTALIHVAIITALAAVIGVLTLAGVVTLHAATVLFTALLGLYVAFGVLIVLYRLISKLE